MREYICRIMWQQYTKLWTWGAFLFWSHSVTKPIGRQKYTYNLVRIKIGVWVLLYIPAFSYERKQCKRWSLNNSGQQLVILMEGARMRDSAQEVGHLPPRPGRCHRSWILEQHARLDPPDSILESQALSPPFTFLRMQAVNTLRSETTLFVYAQKVSHT